MKKLIFALIITFTNVNYSQTYSLINDILEGYKSDSIYIEEKFMSFDKDNIPLKISKESIEELWTPIPNSNTPSIKLFLDNFDLNHLEWNLIKNKNDTVIDFSKLAKSVFKSSKEYIRLNTSNTYISISKPIFNCSKNWAIIFTYSVNLAHDNGSGYMKVYKKINERWVLYHKLELWMG